MVLLGQSSCAKTLKSEVLRSGFNSLYSDFLSCWAGHVSEADGCLEFMHSKEFTEVRRKNKEIKRCQLKQPYTCTVPS